MTFAQALELKLQQYQSRALIADDNGTLSYADVLTQSQQLQSQLPTQRSVILVKCSNSAQTLVNYLACLLGGHVPLLFNRGEAQLEQALLANFNPAVSLDEQHLEVRHDSTYQVADDIALLLPTSGSEGKPKVVMLSQQNLLSNTHAIIQVLPIQADDIAALPLPLAYCYALSVIHTHIWLGAQIFVSEHSLVSGDYWQQVKKHLPTSWCGVPFTYEMLAKLGLERVPLQSVRYFTQAGGKLNPLLLEQYLSYCQQQDKAFYVMYGQTEATARMAVMPFEELHKYPEFVGKALDGGEFRIAEDGEVIYQGDNVMLGYADNYADLAQVNPNNILQTGDLGELEDGYLKITGRKSRFIKYQGKRISLDQIEEQIGSQGDIAILQHNDQLVIFSEQELNTSEIGTATGIHPSFIEWRNVAALPRKANGKLDYAKLAEALHD